jgi:hypothetical protein
MKKLIKKDIVQIDDDLWTWFGLSYASWLTMPRVLMHEMPNEWQKKMAKLLKEWDDYYNFNDLNLGTRVQITKNNKLIKTPNWLINYRHPDLKIIKNIKNK